MTELEIEPDFTVALGDVPHGTQVNADGLLNPVMADRFPEGHTQAVNGLLWLGYLSERVEVAGHTFVIRTLTRGEKLAIAQITKEWEQTLGLSDAYETAMVAASLTEIDGEDMPLPLTPSEDPTLRIRTNFRTVRQWYDPIISELYRNISLLEMKQQAAFNDLQSK